MTDFDPEALFRRLGEAGVQYIVIGGWAVNAHGHRRFTGDLYICPDPQRDNTGRLVAPRAPGGDAHPSDARRAEQRLSLSLRGNEVLDFDRLVVEGEANALFRERADLFEGLSGRGPAVDIGRLGPPTRGLFVVEDANDHVDSE